MPYTLSAIADSLAISSAIEATGSLRRIANSLDDISKILKAMTELKETHHENKDEDEYEYEYENKDECRDPRSGVSL